MSSYQGTEETTKPRCGGSPKERCAGWRAGKVSQLSGRNELDGEPLLLPVVQTFPPGPVSGHHQDIK